MHISMFHELIVQQNSKEKKKTYSEQNQNKFKTVKLHLFYWCIILSLKKKKYKQTNKPKKQRYEKKNWKSKN